MKEQGPGKLPGALSWSGAYNTYGNISPKLVSHSVPIVLVNVYA